MPADSVSAKKRRLSLSEAIRPHVAMRGIRDFETRITPGGDEFESSGRVDSGEGATDDRVGGDEPFFIHSEDEMRE